MGVVLCASSSAGSTPKVTADIATKTVVVTSRPRTKIPGKRRVLSYGWHYDFEERKLQPADDIPAFLWTVRRRAAAFAGLTPEDLLHALITEYRPGTTIGWHRDKGVFDQVIGISLVSACVFRLRRKTGSTWERYSQPVEPRSAYLLRGSARAEWEHSIRAVDTLRYSITFRSLRGKR